MPNQRIGVGGISMQGIRDRPAIYNELVGGGYLHIVGSLQLSITHVVLNSIAAFNLINVASGSVLL